MTKSPTQHVVSPPGPMCIEARPPGSKSLTNRALLLAALAKGRSTLSGALWSEDTEVMVTALRQLGVSVQVGKLGTQLVVEGRGFALGTDSSVEVELHCHTAGTAARFLTAVLAACPRARTLVIDGSARMRQRPMAELVDALRAHGAVIHAAAAGGSAHHLPFRIEPRALDHREPFVLTRPASSQFVSGLVLAAACGQGRASIVLERGTPARPYVDMTLQVLASFGGSARWTQPDRELTVEPQPLSACEYAIEPDASAASYFLALAAIWGGTATVQGLGHESIQGDAAFCRVLERMGARVEVDATTTIVRRDSNSGAPRLRGIEVDMQHMPDMTLTLAACALFAEGSTTIAGVEILRHHESDRLRAAATELRRLGAIVDEREDGLRIEPPKDGPRKGVAIETYLDHRMAMAFALVGDVDIVDPQCTHKTFPGYFDELAKLGMVASA